MTPAEYNAHVSAWYRKQRREQSRIAVLTMLFANANKKKEVAPFSVDDFMGEFKADTFGGTPE